MKTIGIVNFHFSNCNYGAVLQASALNQFLINEGYDAETINFIPDYDKEASRIRVLYRKCKRVLQKVIAPNNKIFNDYIFEDFRKQWLPRSSSCFHSLSELTESNALNYDAFIVGSDQVWRPKYTLEYSPAYFLSFAPDEAIKIAYAPSFGVEYWEPAKYDPVTTEAKRYLEKFTAVSVREKSGQKICQETFNISSEIVLDPTLLIGTEFFNRVIGENCNDDPDDTIVYYKLDVDHDFNRALEIATEQLNTTVQNIYYTEITIGGKKRLAYNDVSTWLSKIKNSRLVITDSFHCICFAILFEKPFLYYPNKTRGFARIESLFSLLSIDMKSIISHSSDITKISDQVVSNYCTINKRLEDLRNSSKIFLLNNLK